MTLYTIGYSGFDKDGFIEALRAQQVTLLIDVRSVPASRFRPEFNQAVIKKALEKEGIEYWYMGSSFGARQEERAYLTDDGMLDFRLFSQSDIFLSGVRDVEARLTSGIRCALMCAEKDPISCHRSIMVGRSFHKHGWKVIHITPDALEEHGQLEKRLLDMHFPQRDQLSILEAFREDEELIEAAYQAQNWKIGFRKEE